MNASPRRSSLAADILVVAAYEMGQARRTRLLQVMVVTYAAATAAAHWVFVQGLNEAERTVAITMGVPATSRPGTLTEAAVQSESMRHFLVEIVGSESVLERLTSTPLLGLWSGVVAMVLLPLFLLFSTSACVASEVETKSIRFLALRTERLPIVLGKGLGQLGMAALAALAGVFVTEAVGLFLMVEQPPLRLALSAGENALRGLVFALPFAGLGLCVSQWIGRAHAARALSIVALLAIIVADFVLEHESSPEPLGRLADIARLALPGQGWTEMWETNVVALGAGAARLMVVTLAWIALGTLRFDRRDL